MTIETTSTAAAVSDRLCELLQAMRDDNKKEQWRNAMVNQVSMSARDVAELHETVQQNTACLNNFIDDWEAPPSLLRDLRAWRDQATDDRVRIKSKLARIDADEIGALRDELDQLRAEYDRTDSEVSDLKAESESHFETVGSNEDRSVESEAIIDRLDEKIEALDDRIDPLVERLDDRIDKLAILCDERIDAVDSKFDNELDPDETISRLFMLEARADRLEGVDSLKSVLATLGERLTGADDSRVVSALVQRSELGEFRDEVKREIRDGVRAELREILSDSGASDDVESLRRQRDSWQAAANMHKANCATARQSLERAHKEYSQEIDRLRDEIDRYETRLTELTEENEHRRDQIERIHQRP